MTDAAPLLAARGVSKSFFGNPVLHDVSIALLPGRVHALLGENGAGKSTLINILSGALLADGGSVEIDGQRSGAHDAVGRPAGRNRRRPAGAEPHRPACRSPRTSGSATIRAGSA